MFRMQPDQEKQENLEHTEETEDGYITSREAMTRNQNSDDLWLQTEVKRLKVQISHSDMWVADFPYYKICLLYRKIPKGNPLLYK